METIDLEQFRPGTLSKAHFGEGLIMACMEIGPGLEDSGHKHPFDQCGVVLEGKIQMFVGEIPSFWAQATFISYPQVSAMAGRPLKWV